MTVGAQLFPALLRYWRTRRGWSQLELGLEAGVSTRHLSFLESARARPSEEMVLRLLTVLSVPLHDQNTALIASGFAARFAPNPTDGIATELDEVVKQMMAQHEPFPLTALSLEGVILRRNRGAERLFAAFLESPEAASDVDLYTLLLDPRFMRPFIVDWASFAQNLVARLHREQLSRGDARLATVLERLSLLPGVKREWRTPDFSADVPPTLRLHLKRGGLNLRFLVAVTTFSTAQHLPLDELRIESCFPLDDDTRASCHDFNRLAARTTSTP